MDRRAKNRLPAAGRSKASKFPLFVLIVSATLCLSPEAMARITSAENPDARPMILVKEQDPGDTYTKTYTKEELKKTLPKNPIVGLNQRLMSELTGLLNGVRRSFSGTDQQAALEALRTLTPTDEQINLHIATLHDAPATRKTDKDKLRTFIAGETQKVGSTMVKKKLPFVDALGAGFNFNLDFDKFFSESKVKNEQAGMVRYSLILKDIKPNDKKQIGQDRAAIGDIHEELQHAGHADVEWTIGPLIEEHNRKILAEPPMDLEKNKPRSFFGIRIPKFSFKGNVTPENLDNISKVGKDAMPTWAFGLSQSEGYYRMLHRTEFGGKNISTEHLFRTPVAGTIELGRRFNDNWDVLQTSAYNILYDKRLPLLSVHYLNVEERYAADLATKIGGATISVTGRTEAKGTVAAPADKPRSYSLNLTKSF